MELQTNEEKNLILFSSTQKTYLDQLKVAYSTSEVFKNSLVKLGSFFIDDTDLGNSIDLTCVDYRISFTAFSKAGKFEGKESFAKTDEIHSSQRYKDFHTKHFGVNNISDGIELLVYIPQIKGFATFFCAKTLKNAAVPMKQLGGNGNIINITTEKMSKDMKTWFNIKVVTTGRQITELSNDSEDKILLFNSFDVEVESDNRER